MRRTRRGEQGPAGSRRLLQVGGAIALAALASACVPVANGRTTDTIDAAAPEATPTTSAPSATPTTTAPKAPPTTTAPTTPTTTAPAPAPTPTAVSYPAFGAQFHATWGDYSDAQRTVALDRLQAAGAEFVRIDVGWQTLEPDRSGGIASWYLRLIDFSVDQARARGMSVILTLWTTPWWANGGAGNTTPPSNPADYGRFAGWVANHFRGRVAGYEIWNEADDDAFFEGTPSQYVGLMRAAYPAIKGADPATKVVGGATVYNNHDFLNAVYAAGGRSYFDVWSTHPYMGPSDAPPELPDDGNPWRLDHVRTIRSIMVAKGDGNKPIWFTEFGWSAHPTASGAPPWQKGVTLAQQADYLVRAMKFVKANHPYVTVMIWYNERNKATGDSHQDNFGLMTRDFQPKPVYTAIQSLLG